MDRENNKKQSMGNKEYDKIYIGIAIIASSPVLGSFLFYGYTIFVGRMISTDSAAETFWFSCIFAVAILGLATVIVGCNEKTLKHKNRANE
ncbi:MAG: hypothetical protein E7211_09180 [Clostridium lundense]|nr:hypothetical protein [Clostridium lundense]